MSQNVSDFCEEPTGFVTFRTATACVVLVGCLVASLVHMIIIRCAFKLLQQTEDPMHLFMGAMSAADLLLTVFAFPAVIVSSAFVRPASGVFCGIMRGTTWFGLATSGLFLTLLNVDKTFFFVWTRKYRPLSMKSGVVASIAVPSVSLTVVASLWLFGIVYFESPCIFHIVHAQIAVYDTFALFMCTVPFLSSLIFSSCLFRMYLNRRTASDIANVAFQNKSEALLFICATSAWTATSLLPDRVLLVWYLHATPTAGCLPVWLTWTAWVFAMLLASSPIGNCLITWLTYAPYRMEMTSVIRRLCTNDSSPSD